MSTNRDIVDKILDPAWMPVGPLRLGKDQVERLFDALKKAKKGDRLAVGQAIHYLARSDPSEATARLIAGFADLDSDPPVRRAAIAALGTIAGSESDRMLVSILGQAPPEEQATILSALAQAGGEAGLEAIRALPPTDDAGLLKSRSFAETAISYRIGEQPSDSSERMTVPALADLPIRSETKRLGEVLARLNSRPFGLEFREDLGFSFDCGNNRHFVLLNRDIPAGKMLKEALSKPRVAAVVVREERTRERFVLRWVVFFRPEKKGGRLSVVSPNGEVLMVGWLKADGERAALSLRNVGASIPTTVQGMLTNEELQLSAHIYAPVRRTGLRGEALSKDSTGIQVNA